MSGDIHIYISIYLYIYIKKNYCNCSHINGTHDGALLRLGSPLKNVKTSFVFEIFLLVDVSELHFIHT